MYSIIHANINRAYAHAMQLLTTFGETEDTRNGPVFVLTEPFCTTLKRSNERVLFSIARKANPFFHLFESMWMLAGRSDAMFLNQYVKDFGQRYAEPNGQLHGAYGYRWRNHFDRDQLTQVVQMLQNDPSTRRAVIAMWDPDIDLNKLEKRDLPCNTHIYLRMLPCPNGVHELDLTVCCRSNDAVWGLFGANAVHFSVLLEYLAWCIGCAPGRLHILSNNLHVYKSTLHHFDPLEADSDRYSREEVVALPLFDGVPDDHTFRRELDQWLDDPINHSLWVYQCPVIHDLLVPMARVHYAYESDELQEAHNELQNVLHTDWRAAAELWLSQRKRRLA